MKRIPAWFGMLAWTTLAPFSYAQKVHEIASDMGSRPDWKVVVHHIKHEALVGFDWVDQPTNRIILIRTQNYLCAVKFASFHTGHHVHKANFFHGDGVSTYAKAKWVEFNLEPQKAMLRKAKPRSISLSSYPQVGIGRLSTQLGHDYIKCGGSRVPWSYPTGLSLALYFNVAETHIQLAPTAWTSFADINLADPRLKWYSYDENNDKVMAIPIALLPGAAPDTSPAAAGK